MRYPDSRRWKSLVTLVGLVLSVLTVSVAQSFVDTTPASALVQDPAFQSLIGTQAIGDGTSARGIKAAVKIGNEIYFGGDFIKVNGSSSTYYLARYDLTTNLVSPVPGWTNKGVVYALSTVTDANGTFLIVGGNFVDAATSTGDYLVKYKVGTDPGEWTPFLRSGVQVMPGSNGTVYSLVWDSSSSTLYVGGKLTSFSGVTGANSMVAVTNVTSASSNYAALGTTTCSGNGLRSLALSGGYLYAAGDCTAVARTPDNTALPFVARRNMTTGVWDSVTTTTLAYSATSTTSVGLRSASGAAGVYPTAVAVDAVSGTVYVGGFFAYIGTSTVTGAQPLNGLMWASSDPAAKSEWKPVVTGTSIGIYPLNADSVRSLVPQPDGVVVSGAFKQLGGTTLGGSNGATTAITVYSRMVKIQGTGSLSRSLATFGGGSGSTIYLDNTASGILGPVDATVGGVVGSYYVVFGNFTNGGLVGANDTAALWKADGSSWAALGATAPLNDTVYATAVTADNRYIYVGGDFTNLGGTASANYLAVYDRQTQAWSVPAWWFPTSVASRFRVRALRISGDYIYIAGISEVSGSTPRGGAVYRAKASTPTVNSPVIAAVGGTKIQTQAGAINNIYAIEFDQAGRLVVGGQFTKIAESTNCTVTPLDSMKSLFRVVLAGTEACEKFRSDSAAPVGSGVVRSIVSATVDGLPVLAVGGSFSDLASNAALDNVAIWDDAAGSDGLGEWLDLGITAGNGPVQGDVSALVVHGNRLYVGGTFSNAGGDAQADNLAAVDMTAKTWSDLGTTPDASVYALAQVGVTLYVGGVFTGSSAIADVKALFQIALAPMSASPDTSISSIVGRTGGSISAGAIYSMAKKRVGSGSNADNYIYIGGTFTDLGGDPTGDRIGLVQPTFNDITTDPVSDVGLDARTVTMGVVATAGGGVTATNDAASVCTWANGIFTLHRVGTCQSTFNHSGGSGYAAAATKVVAFEVLKVDDTINFPTLGDRPYSAIAFDPAVSTVSGRTVTLTVDSGSTSVCSITSGAVQMLGAGTCMITASMAGDTDWNTAVDVTRSFSVTTASQTITFVSPGEQENGSQVTLNATASSGLAVTYNSQTSGVCSTNGAVVSFVAGGNCTVVASQSGDSRFNAAENVSRTFYVWPSSRHDLVWNAWEFPSQAVRMGSTATVRGLAQKTADASVVTEVEWQVDTPSVCSLSATLGSGRRTLTPVAVGTCTLTLSRASDSSFRALAARSVSIQIDAAEKTDGGSSTTPVTVAPVTVNNTYYLTRTGKSYRAKMVTLKPRRSGETIMKLRSSPRSVCSVGNFGTLRKPIWKAVMVKPGTCTIAMTIKARNGKTYRTTTKVIVRG